MTRLKQMRAQAQKDWRAAHARHEREGTERAYLLEQEAYDLYVDICNELHECIQFDCAAFSPDHVFCEEHRPK